MADALFLAISVLTIGSAIAALEMRSLVYGSIALMGTLGGVAGFYVMLDSPFVAMFQLAVYVGSIAVLILFTVMLVKRELIFKKIEDPKRKFAGIGLMLIVILALGAIIMDSGIKSIMPQIDYGKCVFCGLCVDACPFYALYMSNDYELSSFTKEGLIYTPAQLQVKPQVQQDSELIIDKRGARHG